MKRFCFTIILATISFYMAAQSVDEEKKAIKKVIQTAYLEGIQNEGNLEKIDSGIHPGFNLLGIGENNDMWKLPIDEWKKKVEKKKEEGKLPRPADDQIKINYLSIDVSGNAAMVKLEFFVGDKLTFIDYISLYKFEGGWKMVCKIYHRLEDANT